MCVPPNGTASLSASSHCSSLSVLNRSDTGCWKVSIGLTRTLSSTEERAGNCPPTRPSRCRTPGEPGATARLCCPFFRPLWPLTSSFPSPEVTFLSLCKVSYPAISTEAELLRGPLSPHLPGPFLATETVYPKWWCHHFIVVTSYSRSRGEM